MGSEVTQSDALLALIADLYTQIGRLTVENQQLEQQLAEQTPTTGAKEKKES
jgi:hypothetical protein